MGKAASRFDLKLLYDEKSIKSGNLPFELAFVTSH